MILLISDISYYSYYFTGVMKELSLGSLSIFVHLGYDETGFFLLNNNDLLYISFLDFYITNYDIFDLSLIGVISFNPILFHLF